MQFFRELMRLLDEEKPLALKSYPHSGSASRCRNTAAVAFGEVIIYK